MHAFLHKTGKYMENVSIAFLLLLFSSVLVQIIMRNFFNSGSVKLEELARFSLVSLVFLMVPVLIIEKQHIIVDFLIVRLSRRAARCFEIGIQALTCALAIFLLFSVNQVMVNNWSVRTPALRMPNIIMYIPIVLGLVFMAVGSCVYFVEAVRSRGESE